jgi:hypothetical protein
VPKPDKITILRTYAPGTPQHNKLSQCLVAYTPADASLCQTLEVTVHIGSEVPAGLYNLDVKLGRVHAYTDELSQDNRGSNGAHRMKEALNLINMQWVIPDENNEPQPTDRVPMSLPRPTVHLDLTPYDVVISGSTASITLAGYVEDPIADNVPEGKVSAGRADIDSVQLYVNGETTGGAVTVNRSSAGSPSLWKQHPYKGQFSPISVTLPISSGSQTIRLQTSANAAGNSGYAEATVTFVETALPGGSPGGGATATANVYLPDNPSPTVADSLKFFYGLRDPLPDDPVFTERTGEENSLVFHKIVDGVQGTVSLSNFAGLTSGVDSLTANVTYSYADGYVAQFNATFLETGPATNLFRAVFSVGGGGAGQPQTTFAVGGIRIRAQGPGSYTPTTIRLRGLQKPADQYVVKLEGTYLDLAEAQGWYYLLGDSIDYAVIVPDTADPGKLTVIYYNRAYQRLTKEDIRREEEQGKRTYPLEGLLVEKEKLLEEVVKARAQVLRTPILLELNRGSPDAFETLEFQIWLTGGEGGFPLGELKPAEMFNVYDTARGTIDVAVVVSREPVLETRRVKQLIDNYYAGNAPSCVEASFVVPAFYMREGKNDPIQESLAGSGRWWARVGLVNQGTYFFYACAKVKPQASDERHFPNPDFATGQAPEKEKWTYENYKLARYPHGDNGLSVGPPAATTKGPIMPVGQNDKYFRRRKADGETEPFFGLGYARPWNLKNTDTPAEANRWSSAYVPFDKQMADLAEIKGNLFSWWLVSWDSNPVHGKDGAVYNEYWHEGEDYTRKNIEGSGTDKPYEYFDQGRCKKLDALFNAAEERNIAIMLTLWPHPDLRRPGSGWDEESTSTRYGKSWSQRVGRWLNGETTIFNKKKESAAVASNGYFSGWALPESKNTPASFAGGDNEEAEKNFIRYVVARWGCRRGLGLYELISEVGGTDIAPDAESPWRARVRQAIGAVSPYKQPISSSQHSIQKEPIPGDYVSSHGYCPVQDGSNHGSTMNNDERTAGQLVKDDDAYKACVLQGHSQYYAAVPRKPGFCGEVGACQRTPGCSGDVPAALTSPVAEAQEGCRDDQVEWRFRKAVSTFHYTVWTALLSKGAAAPLAWCDGKEFGEMRDRANHRKFDANRYHINYFAELSACSKLITALNLNTKLSSMNAGGLQTKEGLHALILKDSANALVWLILENRQDPKSKVNLSRFDLNWGNGTVKWFNPWTGDDFKTLPGQNLDDLDTRLGDVTFSRGCAGNANGTGAHEKEDVILWVTK